MLRTHLCRLLLLAFCGGTATLFSACSAAAEGSEATGTAGDTTIDASGLPKLLPREGALASGSEWPRTKEKDAELRGRIAASPRDVKARLQLVTIFLAEARITGEHPYYYPATLRMLDSILTIEPKSFEATVYKASVKMSQHQFSEARTIAEAARAINPDNAYVYGVLVDANVELGNYEEAVKLSDKMQALKPSLESYARASYLREIYGDYPGAKQAMGLAVQAGLPASEPQCWSRTTLGYLYEKTGELDKAEGEYNTILQTRPSYAFALRGLARVHRLRHDYDTALSLLQRAAGIMPEFSFYEDMAEIYAARGEGAKAQKTYREVVGMLGEDAASGHSVNLELCRVYTAMGQYDSAAFYGGKEYTARPQNIDVNAALAWVAYKQGDRAKAAEYLKTALRTGSKDPELLYHASEIYAAAGDKGKQAAMLAQARKVNPVFLAADYQ